jgi:hypothetical protein
MNEANKILLEQKHKQLQLNLTLQDWLPRWLPVFNAIRQINKPWSFTYFDCVHEEDLPFWQKALQQLPLANLNIPLSSIKTPANYPVHHKMESLFASRLSVRYMPALQYHVLYQYDVAKILAQAAASLHIPTDDEVYFFYTRFTPVIRLPFSAISLLQEQEIMMPENLCIMPPDYSWLIFRSLEHEWVWGKHANIK